MGAMDKTSVTLNNHDGVKNQAVHQIFHGPVSFGDGDYPKPELGSSSSDSSDRHDNDILRSLAFPEMFDRRCNLQQPYSNTCEWILDLKEYKNWEESPQGLLWIKGNPGAGKSTLMAFLYNRHKKRCKNERQGISLDFFFNGRGVELQRTPLGMLRSLLNQLFRQDEVVRPLVRDEYREKCHAFGGSGHGWHWQRSELEQLLQDSIVLSAQQRQVTIFVDELDGVGAKFASEIAAYFHLVSDSVTAKMGSAKICISCRHCPIPTIRPGVNICVDQHNQSDITTYVRGGLVVDHIGAPDNLERHAWSYLQADIIVQSSGVFQWAHLIMALVESSIADGETVDQDILQNIIKREYRRQSFLLFQWVCHAARPLSVTEMRYVLAATDVAQKPSSIRCLETSDFGQTNERMKQRIRALSGGLIEVVKVPEGGGKETVRVIHHSVTEFLRARGLAYLATLDEDDKKTICVMPDTELQGNDNIHNCPAPFDGSCLNHVVTEYAKIVVIAIFVAMMFSGFPTGPVSG